MTYLPPTFLSSSSVCTVCAFRPVAGNAAVCSFCRSHFYKHLSWQLILRISVRFVLAVLVEGLLGLFAGFLLLIPIGAISSGQLTMIETVFMFLMNLALMAPVFVALYTWTLRSWVVHSTKWAWANAIAALGPCLLMLASVCLFGVRLDTFSEWTLMGAVLVVQAGVGVGIALWQQRLLTPPFQVATVWVRWSIIAWIAASGMHMVIGLMGGTGGIGLWFGTAVAYLVYGSITHTVLAWFALQAELVHQLQTEWQTNIG